VKAKPRAKSRKPRARSTALTTRTKTAVPTADAGLQSLSTRSSWWPVIREPFTGAWQRNLEISTQDVLTFSTIFACLTLIAGDISKLGLKLTQLQDGIWAEVTNSAYSPVLRKPNRYQNRIKFVEYWILCKLICGNTYALKERDRNGLVRNLYILDPSRVKTLVAPDGAVYYALSPDQLSGIDEAVTVPASEIIHDVHVPLYHPLCGVSAIAACGLAAMQGLKIQRNSEKFFANDSQPGGILTAPGTISEDNAKRLKEHWESNFTGDNVGRIAVLGDGLKYEPLAITAKDADLVQQLKLTAENVASTLHVPLWKVGIGPMPAYGNVQAANIEYYSQALQGLIENLELCLDEGLEVADDLGVEVDVDALLRMDSLTQMEIVTKGIAGAVYSPDEGRQKFDLPKVPGGETPYMQQQMFSLKALAQRDSNDPFSKPQTAAQATPATQLQPGKNFDEDAAIVEWTIKRKAMGLAA
jgi:HK97 family phage portal protein